MRMKRSVEILIFALLIILCTERLLPADDTGAERQDFNLHMDKFQKSFKTCLSKRGEIRGLHDKILGGSDDSKNIEIYRKLEGSYRILISYIAEAEAKMEDTLNALESYINSKRADAGKTDYETIVDDETKKLADDLEMMRSETDVGSVSGALGKVLRMTQMAHELFIESMDMARQGNIETLTAFKSSLEVINGVLRFSRGLDKMQCAKYTQIVHDAEIQIEIEDLIEELLGGLDIDKWLASIFNDAYDIERINDIMEHLHRSKSKEFARRLEETFLLKIDKSDTANPQDKAKLWAGYRKRPGADVGKADERIAYWRTRGKILSREDIGNMKNISKIKERGSGVVVYPEPPTTFKLTERFATDNAHELMWQRYCSPNLLNWGDAVRYADELTYFGYSDWRLPTVDEAITLLKGQGSRRESLSKVLKIDKTNKRLWTVDRKDDKNAWYIYIFGNKSSIGNLTYGKTSKKLHVRAVRSTSQDQ